MKHDEALKQLMEEVYSKRMLDKMVANAPVPHPTEKTKKVNKDNYPLQIYIVKTSDNTHTFDTKEAAIDWVRRNDFNYNIIGTYTLSGIKQVDTVIVESDV